MKYASSSGSEYTSSNNFQDIGSSTMISCHFLKKPQEVANRHSTLMEKCFFMENRMKSLKIC